MIPFFVRTILCRQVHTYHSLGEYVHGLLSSSSSLALFLLTLIGPTDLLIYHLLACSRTCVLTTCAYVRTGLGSRLTTRTWGWRDRWVLLVLGHEMKTTGVARDCVRVFCGLSKVSFGSYVGRTRLWQATDQSKKYIQIVVSEQIDRRPPGGHHGDHLPLETQQVPALCRDEICHGTGRGLYLTAQ